MDEDKTRTTKPAEPSKDDSQLTLELIEKIIARRDIISKKCIELGKLMIDHYMNLDGIDEDPAACSERSIAEDAKIVISSNFANMLIDITEARAGIVFYLEEKDEDGKSFWSTRKIGYDPTGRNMFELLGNGEKMLSRLLLTELTDSLEAGDADVDLGIFKEGQLGDLFRNMSKHMSRKTDKPEDKN